MGERATPDELGSLAPVRCPLCGVVVIALARSTFPNRQAVESVTVEHHVSGELSGGHKITVLARG